MRKGMEFGAEMSCTMTYQKCAHQHPQLSPLPDTCKAVYQSHFCWMDHLVDTPKPVALKKCSDLPCPLCVIDFSIYCHNPMRCGNFHLFSSVQFSSVQFRSSVMSNSLWPHESQYVRPPCPSPTPGDYSHSCPLSWWCHPAISSSVVPFSSCPQSLPAAGSFPMSQLFASGGQSTGVSASASVLPMNTQDWSPLDQIRADWISLQSKGLSRVFFNTTVQKHHFFIFHLLLQHNLVQRNS